MMSLVPNIHSSYGLLNKVVATVTDNGSNVVKAFQVYQPVTEFDDETREEESTPTDKSFRLRMMVSCLFPRTTGVGGRCR